MENKVLVLIDADSLCYQSSKETLTESINILDEKVQNIFIQTGATHYTMFISQGKYFRHDIDPGYKGNRGKYKTPLKWLKSLKSYLQENYGAISMNKVEADDLVAYYHKNISDYKTIVASADKDVLKSIVGTNFNYSYKLPDKEDISSLIKGWWEETTGIDSDKFFSYQMIAGDTSDNIITPFPENCALFNQDLRLHEVLAGYIDGLSYRTPSGQEKFKEGFGLVKGVYEFQKNFRLLHLLDCDEDFMREVGELPPVITDIMREVPVSTTEPVPVF